MRVRPTDLQTDMMGQRKVTHPDHSEAGIYTRKQENKNLTKKAIKKTRNQNFLGRVLVFLFSYFLVFFYKFPPLDLPVITGKESYQVLGDNLGVWQTWRPNKSINLPKRRVENAVGP